MNDGRKRGRPRKSEAEVENGYINTTGQKILPASSRFMSAAQVAAELGICRSGAYAVIRRINQDLAAKGIITFSGRVLKSEWIKRTGGA